MADCVLKMENITKQFGVFKANDNVSLELYRGEVLTLLGENGAGKSTLMNILCGLYRQTSGNIYINDNLCRMRSAADAVAYGVGMVHQHFMLIEALTVFQNIILGMDKSNGIVIKERSLRAEILELSQRYGLNINLDAKITELSVGEQQRVEILKTLWRGAEILILDEPTAVLTDEEVAGLFQIIHRLTEEGKSILFISHKLKEVMEISDRIIVLRHGKNVGEFCASDVDEQFLANTMVGHVLTNSVYEKYLSKEQPYLCLEHISYQKHSKHCGLRDISLKLRPGEILGVAGVDGNGQSELVEIVTGLLTPEEGTIILNGTPVSQLTPVQFIREGVSHIPEDRNKMGLVGSMSIQENLILKNPPQDGICVCHGWKLKKSVIAQRAEQLRNKYDIRCQSTRQLAGQLSGGNQQKIILARELERSPKLLVAVHPIRGLDIGAASYVHDSIIEARDSGCAVLLVSTDISEVLQLSDRIIVMYEGQIMLTEDFTDFNMERISMAMSGKEFIHD